MVKGYAGPEDPDKGKPHRHTRAKIRLLLPYLDAGDLANVLWKIADKQPDLVLAAMCERVEFVDDRP